MAKENRKHKDSVFTDLFENDQTARKNVLELYNALFDTNYTDEEVIKVVTLDQVLFMSFKNDVAFMVDNRRIVLSEHQSTINRAARWLICYFEHVENLSESLQISTEEACDKLKEPYEKYLEAKKRHIQI